MNTLTTTERRNGFDRRGDAQPPAFPFFDANNTLVRENRRDPSLRRRRLDENSPTSLAEPAFSEPQTQPENISQKLFLWHNDNIRELSSSSESLRLGRASECEMVIRNRYTSRIHARLEYSNGQFVLIDSSTNGTYVKTIEGEVFLVGEKATLSGNGLISLGTPLEYTEEGTIHFFCY